MADVYITLQNGASFKGKSFGAEGTTLGEIVFTTGMTGYLETLTDPSYYGQIVLQTFPLIGNYGVCRADMESKKSHVKAYVVREWCPSPSNFRCECDIDSFLKAQGIIGVYGVDTRELTKIIREYGVMNARITREPLTVVDAELKGFEITDAVKSVSGGKAEVLDVPKARYTVGLYDFGCKNNIERNLMQRGCKVVRFPYDTTAETALSYKLDGLMLSNGPGDPKENTGVIKEVGKLLGKLPIFGICLGHQLLALASGGNTVKLKYGHRGTNQPVKDLDTGRVYITCQNHGYAVDGSTLPKFAHVSHINVNDKTCEGVVYENKKAFSVQFHPEAAAGPKDSNFLFDKFMDMIAADKAAIAKK
ncbi:MAG: carbamoyl phosphate synthase small subunit [Clostridiaceae bacterium]|jgi:carbamoyl-phosphate synthase small subunit|nr:carbamoyl phosphate synthase small subunit [Clostridiaceae bacterium]